MTSDDAGTASAGMNPAGTSAGMNPADTSAGMNPADTAPVTPAAAASEDVAPPQMRGVLGELRAGVAMVRAGRFHAPPMNARVRRVFYPLSILVALWNETMANAELRRRYLRAMVPQVVLMVLVGLFWVFVVKGIDAGGFEFTATTKGGLTITNTLKDGEKAATGLWALFVLLYSTLTIWEWIVISLTREHHDALSWHVASHVGVPPEERIDNPRVRLDVNWLVTKFKRRVQGGFIMLVSGLPLAVFVLAVLAPVTIALADAFAALPGVATALELIMNQPANLILAVVAAYWLGVFTLGKTAHAWRDEIVDDPFFLRHLDRIADRFPRLLGWLHLYARILRRAVGLVRRPAYVAENARWETAGMVLMRVLVSLPGLYLLVRPLIPVAATVIIAARSPDTLKGLPVSIVLDERQ